MKLYDARTWLVKTQALDVDRLEQLWLAQYERLSTLLPAIMRMLLFTGKATLADLTITDIEAGRKAEIYRTDDRGYWMVHMALYLLSLVQQAPVIGGSNGRKSVKISWVPMPEELLRVAELFAKSAARSRSADYERYRVAKISSLNSFFKWWFDQHVGMQDLRCMKRSDWIAYVRYISTQTQSKKSKAMTLSVVPAFLGWAWVELPDLMPDPFPISSQDYSSLYAEHVKTKTKAFADEDHGDRLIRFLMDEYRPTGVRKRMRRAALIIAATSGLRASEIAHLPFGAWRWDPDDRCHKIILMRPDKLGQQGRPVLLTKEGLEALKEAEELREQMGTLTPRYDARTKCAYVHLFEYRGKLIAKASEMDDFMDEVKVLANLVDESGSPIPGKMHAWRHRFGRRVFDCSEGDLKVVQHLLGHVDPSMTRNYITEDQAKRNARLKTEIQTAKVTGEAQGLLLWLLDQEMVIPAYHALQATMKRSESLHDLLMNSGHALGYGWCIRPCNAYRVCYSCPNFLAEEEHIPNLLDCARQQFQVLSARIEEEGGDLEKALETPLIRRDLLQVEMISRHLEALGLTRSQVASSLVQQEENADGDKEHSPAPFPSN